MFRSIAWLITGYLAIRSYTEHYWNLLALKQAQRAQVQLWEALDRAHTYIEATAKDTLLHDQVYGALRANFPDVELLRKYGTKE